MTEQAPSLTPRPEGYADWLAEVKQRVHQAQQRAARKVNSELVTLYWGIGNDILERQRDQGWGAKVIDKLAHDLRTAFPDMKGFSPRNLKYMRAFAAAWPDEAIVQEVLAQLPWYHQITLLDKLDDPKNRRWYAEQAIENGWSRNILADQIDTRAIDRWGAAVTNFEQTLPKPESDLAVQSLKDPYKLDFLGLGKEAEERAIESAMVEHVEEFLLELGAGFAFVGRQVHMQVGDSDFFIDLLFYHVKLHRYVVIEVKKGKFKPEHLGQLRFYLSAVDGEVATERDDPTIGLLLCETKDKVVAEYALQDESKPMGISAYELTESLPEELKTNLPSIEQIERELENNEEKLHE